MVIGTPALIEAAGFVLGCAAIHRLRDHADRLTPVLIFAALYLGLSVAAFAMLSGPAVSYDPNKADPITCYGFP